VTDARSKKSTQRNQILLPTEDELSRLSYSLSLAVSEVPYLGFSECYKSYLYVVCGKIRDLMLVWRNGNINRIFCTTLLCTIIMVHKGMSSSYRSIDLIGL